MFDVGFFELVLIFVIALLILGPERLPKVVRAVGNWTGRAKAMFSNFQYELEREANNEEMRRKFSKQLEQLGIDKKTLSGESSRSNSNGDKIIEDLDTGNTIAPPSSSASSVPSISPSSDSPASKQHGDDKAS